MLNIFRTLIYPSSGACDCVDESPHRSSCSQFVVCWSFWCGWYLVVFVLQAEARFIRELEKTIWKISPSLEVWCVDHIYISNSISKSQFLLPLLLLLAVLADVPEFPPVISGKRENVQPASNEIVCGFPAASFLVIQLLSYCQTLKRPTLLYWQSLNEKKKDKMRVFLQSKPVLFL